ncbi:hypothetical protein CJ030_MR0G005124 [Morella rubra]|uniref:Protein kinase domain-containing protein n=1 Tax=Morella rubra TaxID=262757 RepID=A0A6A1UMC1_9ROSI|nr:hypothetical protein CJ030_MR0G005124 [Morella rubra]
MEKALQATIAAAASFMVITILFAFLVLLCKGTKKPSRHVRAQDLQARTRAIRTSRTELSAICVDDYESASFDPSLQISMAELVVATNNFSSDLIVGDGSFGLVYEAQLSNGHRVAIKKLDQDAFQGFREFRAEMETL